MDNTYVEKLKKYLEENYCESESLLNTAEEFIDNSGFKNLIVDIGSRIFASMSKSNTASLNNTSSEDYENRSFDELSEWLNVEMSKDDSFQKLLSKHLIEKGYENRNPDYYNKAQIDRRLFSKIYAEKNPSQPDKKTVFKVVIGFELGLDEALEMLFAAGYNFTSHKIFDMIIKFCIQEGIYDPETIDYLLVLFGEKPLYSLE